MSHTSFPSFLHKAHSTLAAATVLATASLLGACNDSSDTDSLNSRELAIEGFTSNQVLGCDILEVPASSETSHYPLECVAWHRNDDALVLNLTNVHTACQSDMHSASATMQLESLNLALTGSDVSKCGNCAYDWSMTIRNASSANQLSLAVFASPSSDEKPFVEGAVDLSRDEGVVCRYASLMISAPSGDARTLCQEMTSECVEGATCHGGDSSRAYCLPQCESDSDCWQVERCDNGLCQLTGTR